MKKKILTKTIVFLNQTRNQILISLFFSIIAFIKIYSTNLTGIFNIEIREIAIMLASIGSILALTTSVTFGFVINFMSQANKRVTELFQEFKAFLYKIDDFLDSQDDLTLIYEARKLSYGLKFVKIDDMDLDDWDKRLSGIMNNIDNTDEFDDPNLGRRIAEYFGRLEEINNQIALERIKQMISGLFIRTLFKGFALLSCIILSIIFLFVYQQDINVAVMGAFPVFFGIYACLLILEICWWIKREEDNMLTFIENDEDEKA